MIQFPPRRLTGRRHHDSAAALGIRPAPKGLGVLPYPVSRVPYPVSRVPCPVSRVPCPVFPRRGLGATAPSPIAAAIASAEGYGPAGNIATRANNPGDLELGDIGYGTITASGGNKITVFPSADAGYAALQAQIGKISSGQSTAGYTPGMSIAQVGNLYAGGSSNWANNVASYLGVSPSTNFATVAGGSPASVPTITPDYSTSDQTALYPPVLASDVAALLPSPTVSPWLWAGLAAALGVVWWVS